MANRRTDERTHWFRVAPAEDDNSGAGELGRWSGDDSLHGDTRAETEVRIARAVRATLRTHGAATAWAGAMDGRGYVQVTFRNPGHRTDATMEPTAWPSLGDGAAPPEASRHPRCTWLHPKHANELREAIGALRGRADAQARRVARAIQRGRTEAIRAIRFQLLHEDSPLASGWEPERTANADVEPEAQHWYPRPSTSPALACAMADRLYVHGDAGCTIQHTPEDPTAPRLAAEDEYLTLQRGDLDLSRDDGPRHDLLIDTKYMPANVIRSGRDRSIPNGWRSLAEGWSRGWGAGPMVRARDAAGDRAARQRREGRQQPRRTADGLHPVVRRIHTLLCRLEDHAEHEVAWRLIADEERTGR